MQLIKAAKYYLKKGISVIATGSDKRAIFAWKQHQERYLNDDELNSQFTSDRCHGIAIICGKISGNLEIIDVDCKYDLTGTLFADLMAAIHDTSPELADKLKIIQTKNGGYHIYYRCEVIGGNTKLAQRPATEDELKANPNEKIFVLIETRGEAGYVIAPPTEGYEKITDNDIPVITHAERELLFEICRSFNQVIVEQPKPFAAKTSTDSFAVTPWEDYNNRGVDDMLSRLEKHGWTIVKGTSDKIIFKRPGKTESKTSGDYSYKHNLFTVFTTSSEFEALKGYKPAAVFTVLECKSDFKEAAKRLSEMGYGEKKVSFDPKLERQIFQKKQDGATTEELIKFVVAAKKTDENSAAEMVGQLEKQWGEQLNTFWDIEIDKDNKKKVHINRTRFIEFLHHTGGFGLYFYDKASTIYRIIRVQDGFVEEASSEQMKKFILEYIDSLPDTFDGGITPEYLKELVMKQYSSLFSEAFLEFCDRTDPDFLKDEQDKLYFAFRNGVAVITKEGIELASYGSLGKHIWKSQVIDYPISIDQSFAPETCEFFQFIQKISGDEESRWQYCLSLIGYLLHKYKDPATPFAVIMAEETENEAEGGGTGKGILVKALSYMLNTERVDGKNFKLDKNFAFQRVNLDTRLVSIEDVRKNVDFEGFFSIITEGITVEKKNKDELYIPYKDAPKILFTTNYTIQNSMAAAKRRQKVFEFAPFFSPANTPRDYFGHNLFDEWDSDEWNRFYNLMFACANIYLSVGIKEMDNSEKLKRKHIKLSFGENALDYWDHYSANGCAEWKLAKDLYHSFLVANDLEKKDYRLAKFKKMLEVCCENFGRKFESARDWNNEPRGQVMYRVI